MNSSFGKRRGKRDAVFLSVSDVGLLALSRVVLVSWFLSSWLRTGAMVLAEPIRSPSLTT